MGSKDFRLVKPLIQVLNLELHLSVNVKWFWSSYKPYFEGWLCSFRLLHMSHKSIRLQASPWGGTHKKAETLKNNTKFNKYKEHKDTLPRMWSGGPCWAEVLPSCRTASCWQGRAVRWRAPRRPPPSWQCPPHASTAGRTWVLPDTRRRMSATSLATTSNSTGELSY